MTEEKTTSWQPSACILCESTQARGTTHAGTARTGIKITDIMQPGHVLLPNGLGVQWTDENGNDIRPGVAVNDLTSITNRDTFSGVPLHKHVPARFEAA